MILRVPSCYKEFQCIADRCQNSCCIGWEIDIDEETFDYYRSLEGPFGERLRQQMVSGEADCFRLKENGWCPFLNRQKLCDICIELGEEALSEVCTEYPRFTMEYGNVREKCLSLSCEEVGRLVFSSQEKMTFETQELPGLCGEETAYEQDAEMEEEICLGSRLEEARTQAIAILQDRNKSIFLRMAEYLCYCRDVQKRIFMVEETTECAKSRDTEKDMTAQHAGSTAHDTAAPENASEIAYAAFFERMRCFDELETLDGEWEHTKREMRRLYRKENYFTTHREFLEKNGVYVYGYEHLLVYFTFRYFMRAVYDCNLLAKAQFAVLCTLMILDMDVLRAVERQGVYDLGDRIDVARIFSKEVEHSEENVDALMEVVQFEEFFSVDRLLEQILCYNKR